jgi:hypothetical protein
MRTGSGSKAKQNCCDGIVVEISGDQLISTCSEGDEHHYTVAKDARITCDGKESDLADLEEGATIRMTLCEGDESTITAIDCGDHIAELDTR